MWSSATLGTTPAEIRPSTALETCARSGVAIFPVVLDEDFGGHSKKEEKLSRGRAQRIAQWNGRGSPNSGVTQTASSDLSAAWPPICSQPTESATRPPRPLRKTKARRAGTDSRRLASTSELIYAKENQRLPTTATWQTRRRRRMVPRPRRMLHSCRRQMSALRLLIEQPYEGGEQQQSPGEPEALAGCT